MCSISEEYLANLERTEEEKKFQERIEKSLPKNMHTNSSCTSRKVTREVHNTALEVSQVFERVIKSLKW